ncbi:hypothetical protein GF367_01565 [Candidatus Woesearchaeota archaeon]|nr:hypothetical protein [Candidatus Woesearchaeota archaeon]
MKKILFVITRRTRQLIEPLRQRLQAHGPDVLCCPSTRGDDVSMDVVNAYVDRKPPFDLVIIDNELLRSYAHKEGSQGKLVSTDFLALWLELALAGRALKASYGLTDPQKPWSLGRFDATLRVFLDAVMGDTGKIKFFIVSRGLEKVLRLYALPFRREGGLVHNFRCHLITEVTSWKESSPSKNGIPLPVYPGVVERFNTLAKESLDDEKTLIIAHHAAVTRPAKARLLLFPFAKAIPGLPPDAIHELFVKAPLGALVEELLATRFRADEERE